MAFKLRSSEEPTKSSPLFQTTKHGEYSANEDGTFSRQLTVQNNASRVNKNMARERASQQFAYTQLQNNSSTNVGSNTGNIFTGRATGSSSINSTGINTSGNTGNITEEDIYKTIVKNGGANIKDGVLSPQTTHTKTQTIRGDQYRRIQKTKKLREEKKALVASSKAKKLASRTAKKQAYDARKAETKKRIEAKKQAKTQAIIAKRQAQ